MAETVASSLPAVTGSGSLLGSLPRMSPRQILAVMVGSATLIAVAVGAWIWTQSPDYRVLYSGLSDRDGGAVISALNQMNVPYRFAEGGGALLVPADKVHDARLRLASQGLPKGSVVGFELVDNQKFGATQFQEQINYQRGLEGELARSIQSLSAVSAARVHLAIPKPSVFLREQQGPSASVLVSLHAGRQLDRSQVTGIINLVASSVPELAPDQRQRARPERQPALAQRRRRRPRRARPVAALLHQADRDRNHPAHHRHPGADRRRRELPRPGHRRRRLPARRIGRRDLQAEPGPEGRGRADPAALLVAVLAGPRPARRAFPARCRTSPRPAGPSRPTARPRRRRRRAPAAPAEPAACARTRTSPTRSTRRSSTPAPTPAASSA